MIRRLSAGVIYFKRRHPAIKKIKREKMKERKVFLYFYSAPPPPSQEKKYSLTVLNSAELFGTSEMIHL